jgi:hypothetical protein
VQSHPAKREVDKTVFWTVFGLVAFLLDVALAHVLGAQVVVFTTSPNKTKMHFGSALTQSPSGGSSGLLLKQYLSLPKMLSGANALKISNLQLNPGRPGDRM